MSYHIYSVAYKRPTSGRLRWITAVFQGDPLDPVMEASRLADTEAKELFIKGYRQYGITKGDDTTCRALEAYHKKGLLSGRPLVYRNN